MTQKKRCLLGMSGGIDSSIAALLLQQEGYDVVGVTFRFWDNEQSAKHIEDAVSLAKKLRIEHFVYDARELFKKEIINYFIEEYLQGKTPVPCTKCNNFLKFKLLNDLSFEKNCKAISTGHYCNIKQKNKHFYISKGKDPDKDQSFFLWALSQDILSKIIFPLGEYKKEEIRAFAKSKGFTTLSNKKDSMSICFSPSDYRSFLKTHANNFNFKPGDYIDEKGATLGKHKGYPFYTIGQRRGLGLHLNKAVFVKEIIPDKNQIVLAPLKSLYKTSFQVKDWHLINPDEITTHLDVITKIRYRKQATPSRLLQLENGLIKVELNEPLEAIAPGQAAVFYKDDLVLGGGIIL